MLAGNGLKRKMIKKPDKNKMKKAKLKINWLTKFLLKLWPNFWLKRFAGKEGINPAHFEEAHKLFSKVERLDFFPFTSGQRGFMLVMDRGTALFFYQDGDHFAYDGYEIGEYEKGEVTIFDGYKA